MQSFFESHLLIRFFGNVLHGYCTVLLCFQESCEVYGAIPATRFTSTNYVNKFIGTGVGPPRNTSSRARVKTFVYVFIYSFFF